MTICLNCIMYMYFGPVDYITKNRNKQLSIKHKSYIVGTHYNSLIRVHTTCTCKFVPEVRKKYSAIPLLRPPKIKTSCPLKNLICKVCYSFLHFLHPMYLWLDTTFGTVQKWSLRPLLDSPKSGLNIGILLNINNALYCGFIL